MPCYSSLMMHLLQFLRCPVSRRIVPLVQYVTSIGKSYFSYTALICRRFCHHFVTTLPFSWICDIPLEAMLEIQSSSTLWRYELLYYNAAWYGRKFYVLEEHTTSICRVEEKLKQDVTTSVPYLKRLVAGFPPRRPGFEHRSSRVGFVVVRVALGQIFS
jgi:hypothetical protein